MLFFFVNCVPHYVAFLSIILIIIQFKFFWHNVFIRITMKKENKLDEKKGVNEKDPVVREELHETTLKTKKKMADADKASKKITTVK